ncbi:MAG: hypothetical protein PHU85_03960 [Phycisphaerae bacterium]|nr:hypothetical protein [Phycisphaerae bacterium]
MRVFKDAKGREWEVSLSVSSLRRVRDNLHVDLLDPMSGTPPLATRLFLDMVLLGEVLYWICYPQIQSRDINADTFGDAMGGAEAKAAYEAFFAELMDFFRNRGRPEVVRVIAASLEAVRRGLEAADRLIETRLEKNLDKAMAKVTRDASAAMDRLEATLADAGPGETSTTSPESSESTPAL